MMTRQITRFLDKLIEWRQRLLGRAVLDAIPTEQFNAILKHHIESGWRKVFSYEGIDAWIDYGRVDFKKDSVKLRFEWDPLHEGRISGPREVVEKLAREYRLEHSL